MKKYFQPYVQTKKPTRDQNQKGITIVELLVVIGLVGFIGASVAQFTSRMSILAREGERRVVALGLVQEGIAAARSVRNNSFTTLNSYANNTNYYPVIQSNNWTFQSGTENINNFYKRSVKMENVCRVSATGQIDNDQIQTEIDDDIVCIEPGVVSDNNTIRVVSTVSWPLQTASEGGCLSSQKTTWPTEITLVTYLTNWK